MQRGSRPLGRPEVSYGGTNRKMWVQLDENWQYHLNRLMEYQQQKT